MKNAPLILVFVATLGTSSLAWAVTEHYDPYYGERDFPHDRPETFMANRGLQVGARFGYAGGVGNVYSGVPVMDASDGALPVTIDAGFRILPYLYVGAYGSWAHVFTKEQALACPSGSSCNASDWRFGLEADVHFLPKTRWDPYVGFGAGYEILQTDVSGPRPVPVPGIGVVPANVSASIIDRGWEFFNITLGFDVRIDKWLGLGPYVMASANLYDIHEGNATVRLPIGPPANTTIPDVRKEAHGIGIVGVRGTLNL